MSSIPLANTTKEITNHEEIARLKAELGECNSQKPERDWASPLRKKINEMVSQLVKSYREAKDFEQEFQLYESQQKYFMDGDDEREMIPWELYKGQCCEVYGKREEATHHLEKGFKSWQKIAGKYKWISRGESTSEFSWAFFQFPRHGKLLCRIYMDKGRVSDAVEVALACFGAIRTELLEHPPVGPNANLRSFLNSFIWWAEIAGNTCTEARQKYMTRHIYTTTISDLKRIDWDSPATGLFSGQRDSWTRILKEKLERLGKDDSDDEDSDDDLEPAIPPSRVLRLASILPSPNMSAPIKCTVSTVDSAKAPSYKALSYAWGGSRKVISYTRADGPAYEAEGADTIATDLKTILVDGAEVTVRPNLFAALRHLRQHNTTVTIWIDAICMNARDMVRRGEWALRVRDIYKEAEEVIIWLGPGDESSDTAMKFFGDFWRRRPSCVDLGGYLFGASTTVPWAEVCDLLRREWWKRIWTLQEFCVAQKLSIHCGAHSIPWSYLQEFTTFVDLESDTYRFPKAGNYAIQPLIDFVKERHLYITLVDEYRMRSGFPLETLWEITEKSESYDPRDKIFALLGILDRQSGKIAPKLNYDYSPCAVYTDMIVYMQVKSYANDIPRAKAGSMTALTLLGEHGLAYVLESRKISPRCDGENCGHRLMCFTNNLHRPNYSTYELLELLNQEYKLYKELKHIEEVVESLKTLDLKEAGVIDNTMAIGPQT